MKYAEPKKVKLTRDLKKGGMMWLLHPVINPMPKRLMPVLIHAKA